MNTAHDIKKESIERDKRQEEKEKCPIYQIMEVRKFLRLDNI